MLLRKKIKKSAHFLLAVFAYWFYGRPARKLIVVGVTGTKGKSTTCRFIASVLESGGYKVGMLTTAEFQINEKRWPNKMKMTMLGRGLTQKMLKQMVNAGCRYAVVETSSEGILQYRHFGLRYDIAVFTNLAPEHVEAHGGFENLKRDKGKIFAELEKYPRKNIFGEKIKKIIIANADDANAEYFLNFNADEKWIIGLRTADFSSLGASGMSRIFGRIIIGGFDGVNFEANGKHYKINIVGGFNVYNALAAIAVGKSQGISEEKIAEGLASVKIVPGRMEFIDEGQNFKVVVDYAHEPLSLTELFTALRSISGGNKIIAVVGSDGGGRDKSKRVKMGEIAGLMADYVIITDVNCFDEDPREIAEMLAVGACKAGKEENKNLFIEIDRKKGIEKAISLANAGDIVAITAKGAEPCIVVANGKKIPWDDRGVAREKIIQKLKIVN
ncbi:MAG: UDP-N-acetylmuramoyl-L-alanyl-D-glutamate--2,6-diaminopimelate ligase [Patescibacteria group bacterium]|nr:UDP-N-acetylmuramoyl-L-alanyl-D-glutamate--2,6-diaminopimelate ligase [Patescibacteria group bacterium]